MKTNDAVAAIGTVIVLALYFAAYAGASASCNQRGGELVGRHWVCVKKGAILR